MKYFHFVCVAVLNLYLCSSGHCAHKSTWKFTDFPAVEQELRFEKEKKLEPTYKQKFSSNAHGFAVNNRRECGIMQWNIGTLFRKFISIKPSDLINLKYLLFNNRSIIERHLNGIRKWLKLFVPSIKFKSPPAGVIIKCHSSTGTLEHLNYFTQHKSMSTFSRAWNALHKKKQRHKLVVAFGRNQNVIVKNATKHETSRNVSV